MDARQRPGWAEENAASVSKTTEWRLLAAKCAAATGTATQSARWFRKRLALFFEILDMLHQFVEFDYSHEVEAEHLVRPFRRFASYPQRNQQAGDQRQID